MQSDQAPEASAARGAAAAAATAAPKRKNRGNLRKRRAADSDEDAPAAPAAAADAGARKAPRVGRDGAPMAFTTKQTDQRAEVFKFESTNGIQVRDNDAATRVSEIHTATDQDNRAIKERALQRQQDQGEDGEGADDQVYRGMTGYRDYRAGFRREQTISSQKAAGALGPLRAPTNIRTTVLVDYQPDVCKDYKETGYCGFGDSCKFLHDRGDYKAGWELDREWEDKQKAQRERMLQKFGGEGSSDDDTDEEEEDDDEVPFACFICRKVWAECHDPVVTRCRHYFCEQCALRHNAKSSKCFVCDQPTGGIFNVANDVIKREKERKKKEAGGS